MQASRDWLQAYPTSSGWHDALAIYQNLASPDEGQTLDLMRLKRAAGVLSAGDYFTYGDIAVRKGYAGEAKAILDQGFAKNEIKKSDPSFSQLYTLASQKSQGDKASLPAAPEASANARQTLPNHANARHQSNSAKRTHLPFRQSPILLLSAPSASLR